MTIYFKNGMTLEVSEEIGKQFMSRIEAENHGYVKYNKLQAFYDLDGRPVLVLDLDEILYVQ